MLHTSCCLTHNLLLIISVLFINNVHILFFCLRFITHCLCTYWMYSNLNGWFIWCRKMSFSHVFGHITCFSNLFIFVYKYLRLLASIFSLVRGDDWKIHVKISDRITFQNNSIQNFKAKATSESHSNKQAYKEKGRKLASEKTQKGRRAKSSHLVQADEAEENSKK